MRLFSLLLLSCLVPFAHASEEAMERFNYLMEDAARRQQAYEAGQERALFCGYCHGETGNSKRPHIPNLASQNPIYLFHSFEKFAKGERVDFVMSKLAKSLTLEDRVNIAVYFSQRRSSVPALRRMRRWSSVAGLCFSVPVPLATAAMRKARRPCHAWPGSLMSTFARRWVVSAATIRAEPAQS